MFKKSHAGFAALITAAVLVLTGCGNSSADNNTKPSVTEETPAAAEPRLSSMRVLHEKTLAADLYEVLVVEDRFKDADGEIVKRVEYPEGEQRRMTIGFAEVEAPRAGECGYEQSLEFINGDTLDNRYGDIHDLRHWVAGRNFPGTDWNTFGVSLPEDDQKLIGPDGETLVLAPQFTGGSLIVSALIAEGYALSGDALGENNTSEERAKEQNLGLWAAGCFE